MVRTFLIWLCIISTLGTLIPPAIALDNARDGALPATPQLSNNLNHEIANLSDPDASIRRNAAYTLSTFRDARTVEPLIAALQDKDADVRTTVAQSLAKSKDPRAVEPLIAAIDNALGGPNKSGVALSGIVLALGEIGDPRAVAPLIAAMSIPHESDPRLFIEALGKIGKPAVEPLIVALNADNQFVRMCGFKAPARIETPEANSAVIDALKKMGPKERQAALMEARERKDTLLVDFMIASLKDPDPLVRSMAARALRVNKSAQAEDALIAALNDPVASVQGNAAESLRWTKDSRATEPLLVALHSADANVRKRAVLSLGEIRAPRAFDSLVAVLKDNDADVQRFAAQALGKLKDARAVEPLIVLLNDKSIKDTPSGLRSEVIQALGQIADPREVDPLIAELRDPDSLNRLYTANALGDIGAPAIDRLFALMKDTDLRVRAGAARALGRIQDPRAAQSIVAALHDKDSFVLAEAADALCHNKSAWVTRPLMIAFRDPNSGFRERCLMPGREIEAPIVEPLIAALNEPDDHIRTLAARTLALIVTVRILMQMPEDPTREKAVDALIARLKMHDDASISGAYSFFVALGIPGSEQTLIETLDRSHDWWQAAALLTCGNAKLEVAARKWLTGHGFPVHQDILGPYWGFEQKKSQPGKEK